MAPQEAATAAVATEEATVAVTTATEADTAAVAAVLTAAMEDHTVGRRREARAVLEGRGSQIIVRSGPSTTGAWAW